MYDTLIVYEAGTESFALALGAKLQGCFCAKLDDIKNYKNIEAKNVGFVYLQSDKGISRRMQEFLSDVRSYIDAQKMEYLFSACVGISRPHHSLKIVQRLCFRQEIAPSYSVFVDAGSRADRLQEITEAVRFGQVRLPSGSPFTGLYMKSRGI